MGLVAPESKLALTPALTMYTLVVELSDCDGKADSVVGSGPNETKSTDLSPATISSLLRTQYWAPRNPVFEVVRGQLEEKMFPLTTNLSSLTPMSG